MDPCAKQMHVKRGPKVDPLRIESGPSWRVCFWPLYFIRCAEALQATASAAGILNCIRQPALLVFVGDHRQTPGGLSKGRAAAANRQKLLQRPLQGRPQLRLQKLYISISGTKNEPKTDLLVLVMTIFSVLLMKEVPCFQSLQSRRFEARQGLAEATPRTQNVLAQGQSEAYGDSKLYNTIVEVPARLNLK